MSVEWEDTGDRTTDLKTLVSLILAVGTFGTALSFAMSGSFDLELVGEYILAVALNVLTIPIAIFNVGEMVGRPELFEFAVLEWNVVILLWVLVGWSLSDAIFRVFGILSRPMPEPSISGVFSAAGIGIITGGIVETAIGGGVETVGQVWVAITFNILLIPTFIFGEAYNNFQTTEWLVVIGAVTVTALTFALLTLAFYDGEEAPMPASLLR